jgi:hypothetical protein
MLAAALLFLLVPVARSAPQAVVQPDYTVVPCLDVLAVNSTSVFIAKIQNICGAAHCDGQNNAIVNIERFLKGGDQTGEAQEHINASTTALLDWKEHGSRLLLFSGSDGQPAYAVQNVENLFDLSDPNVKVLTADMKVLTQADQIVKAAERAIARRPGVARIYTVQRDVPPEVARLLDVAGSPVTYVPADRNLEHWAESVLNETSSSEEAVARRTEAASALRYFKSDKHVQLLTKLLGDPSTTILRPAEDNLGLEVRAYRVREQAYEVLTNWGVNVAKPEVRVQTSRPDAVTTVSISSKADFVRHADLDALTRFPNLQTLRLINDRRMTDQAFRSLGALKTLRTIDLSSSSVNDLRLMYLGRLGELTTLRLNNTNITNDALVTIAGFTSLKHLDIIGTHLSGDAINDLRKKRPELEIVSSPGGPAAGSQQ